MSAPDVVTTLLFNVTRILPQRSYNVAATLIIGCQGAITKGSSELFLVIETLKRVSALCRVKSKREFQNYVEPRAYGVS